MNNGHMTGAIFIDRNLSMENVTYDVHPKGSFSVLCLFLLIFNDIDSVLHHSRIVTYADHLFTGKNRRKSKLQEDFNAVDEWLESMDLVYNMKKGKTEVMLFGRCLVLHYLSQRNH